jgi:hypothetical protein
LLSIARFAQNLGMSSEAVTAAITQVEGPNRFYFAVQLPDFGKIASSASDEPLPATRPGARRIFYSDTTRGRASLALIGTASHVRCGIARPTGTLSAEL